MDAQFFTARNSYQLVITFFPFEIETTVFSRLNYVEKAYPVIPLLNANITEGD